VFTEHYLKVGLGTASPYERPNIEPNSQSIEKMQEELEHFKSLEKLHKDKMDEEFNERLNIALIKKESYIREANKRDDPYKNANDFEV